MRWKVLASSTKTWSWGSWTSKNGVAFLIWLFLITSYLNIDISSKMRLCSIEDLFLLLGLFCSIYAKYTNLFTFFREILKFWNYHVLSFCVYYHCQTRIKNLLKHLSSSFFLNAVNSFHKKIGVLNKRLFVTIDCNMYYCLKVTLEFYY